MHGNVENVELAEGGGEVKANPILYRIEVKRVSSTSVPDPRGPRSEIPLSDALMAGLGVFGLKYPSLLKFDEASREGVMRYNLNTLYGVERAPCDTRLRAILDPVAASPVHGVSSGASGRSSGIRRRRRIATWTATIGSRSMARASLPPLPRVLCQDEPGSGYYHQLLGAVLVHPALKTVLPLAAEPITRQVGASKNDCERNAAKCLLRQ